MGSSEILQVRVWMGSKFWVDMGSTALVDMQAGSAHACDRTCVKSKLNLLCAFTTRLLQASVCLLHGVLLPIAFATMFAYCCERHQLCRSLRNCLVCICLWLLQHCKACACSISKALHDLRPRNICVCWLLCVLADGICCCLLFLNFCLPVLG